MKFPTLRFKPGTERRHRCECGAHDVVNGLLYYSDWPPPLDVEVDVMRGEYDDNGSYWVEYSRMQMWVWKMHAPLMRQHGWTEVRTPAPKAP
jgi:hypothetical protein